MKHLSTLCEKKSEKKRRFSKNVVFVEPKIADLTKKNSLHSDGFMIFCDVFECSTNLVQKLYLQVDALGADTIFNHDDRTGEKNDCKRHQKSLDTSDTTIAIMDRKIRRLLKKKFPQHTIDQANILVSQENCRVQPCHTDYSVDKIIARCEDSLMPLGALVAVENDSKILVWPGSIRLQSMDAELLKQLDPIDPIVVNIPKGSVFLFRGDLFHCGAGYDKKNIRLHYYVDSPKVPRKDNQTWLLHMQNKESDQDLIRLLNLVSPDVVF